MSDYFQYLIVTYLVDDLIYSPQEDSEEDMFACMQAWIHLTKDVPVYEEEQDSTGNESCLRAKIGKDLWT